MLFIVGPPKSKKTFLTQNFALSIAMGNDFAGFKIPKPKKVLYLLAEGGYFPNRDRIKLMSENIEITNKDNFDIAFPTRININNDQSVEFLTKKIKASKAEVLIIDPFVRFHDADENSASAMSEVLGAFRELTEKLGISIILVHHTGKIESKGGRGSSAIIGEYDSCITIRKNGDTDLRLTYDMRHVETPPSNLIRFNSKTLWFENQSGIVEVIQSAGGCLPKEDLIKSYGNSKATTYRHLNKVVDLGLVYEEDGILTTV